MTQRPPSLLRKLSLLLASLSIASALMEAVLHLIGFSYPSFYTRDPIRGYGYRPGAEGWQREEGEAYIRINREGFRDREHTIPKPPGTLRIAVLGDSVAAALQVPMEQTAWAILEQRLSGCPVLQGKKAEVLNFGVDGYGTAQELLTLRHHVWKYAPDIVLLCFMTGNDVRNNYRRLNEDPTLGEGRGAHVSESPYFVYQGGRLVLDDSFRNSPSLDPAYLRRRNLLADMMNRFRLLQLVNKARNQMLSWISAREAGRRMRDRSRAADVFACPEGETCKERDVIDAGERGLDTMVLYPPRSEAWKEAWRVTEGLLLLMRDEVRDHGAEFLMVIATNGMQVQPDLAARQATMKRLGVDTLLYADLRLQALAERANISVLPLAVPLAAEAEAERVFFHGFKNSGLGAGHWNELGHRRAGEIIFSHMCGSLVSKVNSQGHRLAGTMP